MADITRAQAVLEGLLARVVADATLVALLGSADNVGAFETEELEEHTPTGIFYEFDDAREPEECFEPLRVSWHIWAKPEAILAIEKQLRFIVHPQAQMTLGGATVISRSAGSSSGGGSKRAGMKRRIVETQLFIVRQHGATV